jgi:hypothetical protein
LMKLQLWLIVAIIGVASAIAVRYVYKKHRAAANTATAQAALLKYSQELRPGLSRNELEGYLREQGASFMQRCSYEERSAFAVLVKVGEEDVPWFCSEWPDYVVFEFAATEPHEPHKLLFKPINSDVLKKLHWLAKGKAVFDAEHRRTFVGDNINDRHLPSRRHCKCA